MSKNSDSGSFEQLMAEADELMGQINSEALKDMEEDHRIQFEKHAQNLKKIKSEVQGETGNKDAPGINAGADGMHEAIRDIVKAMQNLKSRVF